MKVMVIDDEYLMLEEMEYLLSQYRGVEIAGLYSNAKKALKNAEIIMPDAVFMDIDMPGMNGLELALKIQEKVPDVRIVFITAYSEYALEAYSTHPIDYLLKPVEKDRLFKTLDFIRKAVSASRKIEDAENRQIKIQCFGTLNITDLAGRIILSDTMKLNNQKERKLLAYLIYRFDRPVSRTELLELLFDGADSSRTINHMHVMIHDLRQLFSELKINFEIRYSGGRYFCKIAPQVCDYVDFVTFVSTMPTFTHENEAQAMKIAESFCRDYLENEDYPWIAEVQQWLEKMYGLLLIRLSCYYEKSDRFDDANQCLKELVSKEPLIENGWHALLRLYLNNGNKLAFVKTYEKYAKILKSELFSKPEPDLTEYYKKFTKKL